MSEEGLKYFNKLLKRVGKTEYKSYDIYDIERDCPELVATVEKLKERSFGQHASLKVVEIPDDISWVLEERDGAEWIAEEHETWE